MLTVKVDIETGCVNLGGKMASMENIRQGLAIRGTQNVEFLEFWYEEHQIVHFQQLLQIAASAKKSSIKIKAILRLKPKPEIKIEAQSLAMHQQNLNEAVEVQPVNVLLPHESQQREFTNDLKQEISEIKPVPVPCRMDSSSISSVINEQQILDLSQTNLSEMPLPQAVQVKPFVPLVQSLPIHPLQEQQPDMAECQLSSSVNIPNSPNTDSPMLLMDNKSIIMSSQVFDGEASQMKEHSLYTCYKCEGKGMIFSNQGKFLCAVCEGKGEFVQDGPFITFLDRIIHDRIVKHFAQSNYSAEQTYFRKPELKMESPQQISRKMSKGLDYNVLVSDVSKPQVQMPVNKPFYRDFQVENLSEVSLPDNCCIFELDSKESIPFKSLKPKEKSVVRMGPFVVSKPEYFERKFFLNCTKNGEIVIIGNRFGLKVKGVPEPLPEKQVDKFFELIDRIKRKTPNSEHKSTENLVFNLREILSTDLSEELIMEMIEQS